MMDSLANKLVILIALKVLERNANLSQAAGEVQMYVPVNRASIHYIRCSISQMKALHRYYARPKLVNGRLP